MNEIWPSTPYLVMEQIDSTRERASRLVEKYLRKSGWDHVCDTPGSVWMWRKEIDGQTYLVGFSDAEQFQRELDYREMNKPHDPVYDPDGACIVCGSSPDDFESPHRDSSPDIGG